MKKLVVLFALILCIVFAGTAFAVPQDQKVSTKQVMVDRNGDGKIDGVDIYDESGKVVKRGYDTNGDGMVEQWETYDQNTGLPVITKSDSAFELR